jgi:dTDP-4-dehydrorhamnose reductase
MKILVVGSLGQLGTDLMPALSKEGFSSTGVDMEELDVTERDKVMDLVARVRPGLIINCAAYTLVDQAERDLDRADKVNSEGPRNLAEAAKKAHAHLVHISTDFVFDGKRPTPYKEDDPTNPLNVYGRTKLGGEHEVSATLVEHVIVRTSWLYGTSGHNFVKTILRYASEREFLRVVYDQTGTPTWTADLSGALVRMAKVLRDEGRLDYGVYHYSNEGVASWYDFAVAVVDEARQAGMELRCRRIEPILTSDFPTPAKRPAYSVLDKQKIKRAFGLSIPHWRASLREMLKSYYGGHHA